MKKKKNAEREEARENKPWLLQNIAPEVRKIAKDAARKHNVKVAEWVTHAIIKTYKRGEEEETVDTQTFSEMMEEFPDKEFMKSWFIGLRGKIDDLSKKIEETCEARRPWWKF
jgi:hypothetical protein